MRGSRWQRTFWLAWLGTFLAFGCSRTSGEPPNDQALTAASLTAPPEAQLRSLAEAALDASRGAGDAAKALRSAGPEGLAMLLRVAEERDALRPEHDRVFDAVAGQRYARISKLYWHTDLGQALARARAEGKGVVSLRLLGELTDELSCANSRFFRVVLYPDPKVRRLLSESFVLHWSSERPVPKITVDYGDGRKLVRTITGNSVHYVLDARGRVVDAVPGLQDPAAFQQALTWAMPFSRMAASDDAAFAKTLKGYHSNADQVVRQEWRDALADVGVRVPISYRDPPPTAANAVPIAIGKGMVERPLLVPFVAPGDLEGKSDDEVWRKLGEARRGKVRLAEDARALMRELLPRGFDRAGNPIRLEGKAFDELVARFEATLAADTQKNRYFIARRIHERLAKEPLASFDDTNRFIYSSLFLTPRADPWLGLTAAGAFSALPEDGVVVR